MEYELYHHGIKGMKWGVRRYQNKDGSLTPAGEKRLKNYKEKELEKVTNKYQVEKLSNRKEALEEKYLYDGKNRTFAKLTQTRYRLLKAESMEFLEKKAIESMSFQDMRNEKNEIRSAKAQKFISGLGQTLVGKLIGESSGGTTINTDNYKTNRRIGLDESIYVDYEARKATGYRGLY